MALNETFFNEYIFNSIEPVKENIVSFNYVMFLYGFLLPIILIILGLLFLSFKKQVLEYIENIKLKNNYIKIWMIGNNKHIKVKTILMDKYNTFRLNKKKYVLDDLRSYIIGYIKGIPVLLFDSRFIFPLTLNEYTIKKEILNNMGIKEDDISQLTNKEKQLLEFNIKALYMRVDSSLLDTVYSKKLISDLYDASSDFKIDPIMIYAGLGLLVFALLWFTGIIPQILTDFGVNI